MTKKQKISAKKALEAARQSLQDAIVSLQSATSAYESLGGAGCECNGKPIRPGGECCRKNCDGEFTIHRCAPGAQGECASGHDWIDTGEPCEPPPGGGGKGPKPKKKKAVKKKATKKKRKKA